MVRAVRATGNGSLIWPKGCTSVEDISIELLRAISHANRIIDWQENLLPEEIPPEWMWHLDFELDLWFQAVEEKRDARYGSNGGDETVPMMGNELAKGRRG